MNRIILIIISAIIISSCSSLGLKATDTGQYPQDPKYRRRDRTGSLAGEGGIKLLGEDEEKGVSAQGLPINAYLWRSTLETLSFVPLGSADPTSGVIITDWYENPGSPGERFKINVLVLDKKLRVDALKVSVFKQVLKNGVWRDAEVSKDIATDLENKILTKAREMRVASEVRK